jgi:hypothetical protein
VNPKKLSLTLDLAACLFILVLLGGFLLTLSGLLSEKQILLAVGNALSGNFISALAGAFFGAVSAYWFQQKSERTKVREENHAALVRTLYGLAALTNSIKGLEMHHLDEFRSNKNRYALLQHFFQAEAEEFPVKDLAFLLTTSYADIYGRICIAQLAYRTTCGVLRKRNEEYDSVFKEGENVREMDIETGCCKVSVTSLQIRKLKNLTDSLYESTADTSEQLKKAFNDLRTAGLDLYPGWRILDIVFIKLDKQPSSAEAGMKGIAPDATL